MRDHLLPLNSSVAVMDSARSAPYGCRGSDGGAWTPRGIGAVMAVPDLIVDRPFGDRSVWRVWAVGIVFVTR